MKSISPISLLELSSAISFRMRFSAGVRSYKLGFFYSTEAVFRPRFTRNPLIEGVM
jgi:hypothetical protein